MCVWIEDADGIQMDDKSLGIPESVSLALNYFHNAA